MILNEYGWLWLNRDGTPTLVTNSSIPRLLGDKDTTGEPPCPPGLYPRRRNRVLARLPPLRWRAPLRLSHASHPKAFTSDHWLDLKKLELKPTFSKAMENAFNPLGVYLNFWHPTLTAGQPATS